MIGTGHVIWDWNGTLLDDFAITAEICATMIREAGREDVTHQDIRDHHTRPFSLFFQSLVGRAPTEQEMADNFTRYAAVYDPIKRELPLASDALAALDHITAAGIAQSILSMAPHSELTELVGLHQITPRFLAVRGAAAAGQEPKAASLKHHLSALALDPARVVMIGDTVDDYEAAMATGVTPVLVTTGMHAAHRLRATGAPVAESISEAADIAARLLA